MPLTIPLGGFWKFHFPYSEDTADGKYRPACVVGWSDFSNSTDKCVLVVPVTKFSNGGIPRNSDVLIPDPNAYGLSANSHIRSHRVLAVHPSVLRQATKVGTVPLDESTFLKVMAHIDSLNPSDWETTY